MASSIYKNVKVYSGGYDLTELNSLTLGYEFEEVDATKFGDSVRWARPGLAKLAFDFGGHVSSDGTDENEDVNYSKLASVSNPMTFAPLTGADGEAAYFAETLLLNYSPGGSVGDMYDFTASGTSQGTKLVRGTIMGVGTKTSTANGTARQLGAVSATQYLYACLHVYSVSGTSPTLDVIVESDDGAGFASGTTRATFTQKTAIGSQFVTPVAGAITDDYWRVGWTIGGSDTPTFGFIVTVGIL